MFSSGSFFHKFFYNFSAMKKEKKFQHYRVFFHNFASPFKIMKK